MQHLQCEYYTVISRNYKSIIHKNHTSHAECLEIAYIDFHQYNWINLQARDMYTTILTVAFAQSADVSLDCLQLVYRRPCSNGL